MPRETVDAKARRLLVEGRVTVIAAGHGFAVAHIRGDAGNYVAAYRQHEWSCDCRNPGRCSHLLALRTVTAAGLEESSR